MGKYMMGIGDQIQEMAKELTTIDLGKYMKGLGKMTKDMERADFC